MEVSTCSVGHTVLSDAASSSTEVELCKREAFPTRKYSKVKSHPVSLKLVINEEKVLLDHRIGAITVSREQR